jgi:hypothetical protein
MHCCSTRHKPDFGGKSEAGKSEAIVSARQHRPEGQNPIAAITSRRNAAQAWLRRSTIRKSVHRFFEKVFRKDHASAETYSDNRFNLKQSRFSAGLPRSEKIY